MLYYKSLDTGLSRGNRVFFLFYYVFLLYPDEPALLSFPFNRILCHIVLNALYHLFRITLGDGFDTETLSCWISEETLFSVLSL